MGFAKGLFAAQSSGSEDEALKARRVQTASTSAFEQHENTHPHTHPHTHFFN